MLVCSARRAAYGIEPHLIDVAPVLVLGQLDTPFSAIFIRIVFPCRDDTFLHGCNAC